MEKYFFLQFKRNIKLLPCVLCIALILFVALSSVLTVFIDTEKKDEQNLKFKIGIAGDATEQYLDMGLAALKTFDSSKFALDILRLDEQEAKAMLNKGDISAYVVIPDGFVDAAMEGEIKTIKYVTGTGAVGLNSIFKDEITAVISDILEYSQRGVYGVYDALKQNGFSKRIANKQMNRLNIQYIDFILQRSEMYKVEVLGIADGTQLPQYMFCGITVVFFALIASVFAHLHIKRDNSLHRILYSKGVSLRSQILTEYFAFAITLIAMELIVFALLGLTAKFFAESSVAQLLTGFPIIEMLFAGAVVILLISAMAFMIFELSDNLISGILIYFFLSVFMCYISGCLYPIYTLPVILQKISVFTPTGICRSFLSSVISDETDMLKLAAVAGYAVLFILVSITARHFKSVSRGGNIS